MTILAPQAVCICIVYFKRIHLCVPYHYFILSCVTWCLFVTPYSHLHLISIPQWKRSVVSRVRAVYKHYAASEWVSVLYYII